jgi:hypothetical protein
MGEDLGLWEVKEELRVRLTFPHPLAVIQENGRLHNFIFLSGSVEKVQNAFDSLTFSQYR